MISDISNDSVKENDMRKTRSRIYNSTELQKYHELLKKYYLNTRMKYWFIPNR